MNTKISVQYLNHQGDDLTVVNAARCSFDKESLSLSERDKKLITYLAEHEHWAPFGHCFASFRVNAPLFVCRQIYKHKFIRFSEVSRRYIDKPPEFYSPDVWRGRAEDKKQGSAGQINFMRFTNSVEGWAGTPDEFYGSSVEQAFQTYESMITSGIAPEMARMVLPQSMMTTFWMSGSLDAFANMCKLRLKDDTQYETRLVAQEVSDHMSTIFPVSWESLIA